MRNKKNKFFRCGFFLKNRKAMMLAEETLKTVIAVIVIVFLVYFLVNLYFANVDENKQKQAEATLERISEIVESSGNGEVMAITPKEWHLFSFTGGIKPNSCTGKSCLCICDNVVDVFDRQVKECSDDGRCLIIQNLQAFEETKIEVGTNLGIKKIDNKIVVEKI